MTRVPSAVAALLFAVGASILHGATAGALPADADAYLRKPASPQPSSHRWRAAR